MDNDIRLVFFSRGSSVNDFIPDPEVSVKYSCLGDAITMIIKRGHRALLPSLISNLLIVFFLFIQEVAHFLACFGKFYFLLTFVWLSFNYFMTVNYLASFQESFTPNCKLITGDLSLYPRHFLISSTVCQHLCFIHFCSDSFEQVWQFIVLSPL